MHERPYTMVQHLIPLLAMLLLAPIGGVDTGEMQPYLELSWPPAGHALIVGEEQFSCVITVYDLPLDMTPAATFNLELLEQGSGRRISGAGGPVEGQTELQLDGSRVFHVNMEGLQPGKYAFKASMLIMQTTKTSVDWHPFQVQRGILGSPRAAGVFFPSGTPGEEAQETQGSHQVVALVRMRNCARSAKHFLRALSVFVHQMVVLDDASVDGNAAIVEAVAGDYRIARIIAKGPREEADVDVWGDMQALLEEGRRIGGTHFVVIHADELPTTSLVSDGTWWDAMRALEVGESLSLSWVHFWKSLRYARADWMLQHRGLRSLRVVDVAFRDDGQCSYLSNKAMDSGLARHSDDTRQFDLSRIPRDLKGSQVEIRGPAHALLHLGFVDWIAAMHRVHLRRLITRLRLPDADGASVNGVLAEVVDEAGVHGVACSWQMFGNWSEYGVDAAEAYGLRGDNIYAQTFHQKRQLRDPSLKMPALNPAAADGNHCWHAQAAQKLLAQHANLESIAAGGEGDTALPSEARVRAEMTFSVASSRRESMHIHLMGTPTLPDAPKVCVLVSTKRPGGIDAILYSLAKQSSKDFELVMVDELWEREHHVRARAEELGIRVTAISISKPKQHPLAFGFQNAWNTGLASCRGPYLAIVNDYAWLSPDFVSSIIDFYEDVREDLPPVAERRLALLSFPIIQYAVPENFLDREKLLNNSLLSVFREELKTPPRDLGWEESDPLGPLDTQETSFKPHWFWDGQAMVVTRGAIEAVNGFDEVLDYGNDCHMQNIRDRVSLLGGQVWLAPARILVQEIDHHNWFPQGETKEYLLYNRLSKDTNLDRWARLIGRIRRAEYSNRATNFGFDLSDYYQLQHDMGEGAGGGTCKWKSSPENWKCHI